MEKIKLKIHFRGRCVYVDIDDTDKSLLIDVINDYYDEAKKIKAPIPKHPSLSYSYKMKSVELLDDKGLMEMFSRFEGENEIDIWIGCATAPSTVLQMAGKLRGVEEPESEPDEEIFPVAVGVVEAENKETWSNFFWHLKQVLSESGREDWTIISDRQKGIEPALDQVWPSCYRRFCARHLCKNFKKDYPGVLMHKLFWKIVNAYSEFVFKKAFDSLVQHRGHGCGRWFMDLGNHEQWARYRFDPRVSNDENTSNFVESFNSTLGVHRNNPVLSLLEGIKRMSMVRHATRQHVAESWPDDGICPNIRTRIRVLKKESRFCEALPSSTKSHYEVRDGRTYLPVSLTNRTCKCGQWQITGIPCKHAIRAIITANKEPEAYVSDWFSVARYKVAYGLSILPIPDSEQWPTMDCPRLEPPTLKRSIGRPSRNRRRELGEQRKGKRSTTVKCKKCGCFGHNSKTCKGGLTAKEKQQQLRIQTRSQVTEIGEGSQSQTQVGTSTNVTGGKKRKASN